MELLVIVGALLLNIFLISLAHRLVVAVEKIERSLRGVRRED